MKKLGGLIFVIASALLLEFISAVQYYYMYGVLTSELEHRAESELFMKAIIIRSMLNRTQTTLSNNVPPVQRNIHQPDSMYNVMRTIIDVNPDIVDSWIAFRPDFYPQKGRLYEPAAFRVGDTIRTRQVAGADHDYTTMPHYLKSLETGRHYWTDPYLDRDGSQLLVTTCSLPVSDETGQAVGVLGADLSLDWLADTLNVRHIYPSSFLILLTEDGDIISLPDGQWDCPDGDGRYAVSLINDSTVNRTLSASQRSSILRFRSPETGEKAQVFYANMRGQPHWQIGVVCYDDEAYASLYRLRRYMLLLNALIVAILVVIVFRFLRGQRRLDRTRREQQRMKSELQIAGDIQQSMLPCRVK